MDEQQAIGLALRVVGRAAAIEEGRDLRGRPVGKVAGHGLRQDLGPGLPISGGDGADLGVAARIHETQRGEAVEPGIGDLLDHLLAVGCAYGAFEIPGRLRVFAPRAAAVGQHHVELGGHLIDQQIARPLGKFLEGVGVHLYNHFLARTDLGQQGFLQFLNILVDVRFFRQERLRVSHFDLRGVDVGRCLWRDDRRVVHSRRGDW